MRVVALDLPTSWMMATNGDEFTVRMFEAINGMLLDMLARVLARTTSIGATGRRKARRRRRLKVATRGVRRMWSANSRKKVECALTIRVRANRQRREKVASKR
jgi:hypothetical protein